MKIGIIGGTGLSALPLESVKENHVDAGLRKVGVITGTLNGAEIAFLHRHNQGTVPPHEIDHKSNLSALHRIGCKAIIATTACGSLHRHFEPETFQVPTDLIDFTAHESTFIHGKIEHPHPHPPFDSRIRHALILASKVLARPLWNRECTMVSIRGPRFATYAESKMYALVGGHLINMTTAPEAILAKELGVPYAPLAYVTDYDTAATGGDASDTEYNVIKGRFESAREQLLDILPKAVEELKVQFDPGKD